MSNNKYYEKYELLFTSLAEIIKTSERRVLQESPDFLFVSNVNFFVKSYLINICTYLEAFLQDTASEIHKDLCVRLNEARIPHNFLLWKTAKKIEDKDLKFKNATLIHAKDSISDALSANPYRTLKLFRYLGINLVNEPVFEQNKDLVLSIVNKRNNIIHHNDVANDISFTDILSYIEIFLIYMAAIQVACDKTTNREGLL